MLSDDQRRRTGYLCSEVARPRPLTTSEARWVTEVLGGLGAETQADLELRMSSEGPLLVGHGDLGGLEVRAEGPVTTILVTAPDGRCAVHRYRDRTSAVLDLITRFDKSARAGMAGRPRPASA